MKHLLLKIIVFLAKNFIVLLGIIEIPFFLIKNRKLFANATICPYHMYSFGNDILYLDSISRLFYPNRVSLIYFMTPRSNRYLPFCFVHNIDVFVYDGLVYKIVDLVKTSKLNMPDSIAFSMCETNYLFLRAVLLVISAFISKYHVLTFYITSKVLPINKVYYVSDTSGDVYGYGYLYLLKNKIGLNPKLPDDVAQIVQKAIHAVYPEFFTKPFVTLLLVDPIVKTTF
ncbi:hypothetical protein [Candidatus Magnetomonas plexicatena]|uniref:hypothetical protein n=1 Tax=Candidatus Magnetomonas plexicatena TaxID=2552947 RepID=UPI001C76813F|nr:hypothetical protein E2O03_006485 [Nitrospirales bacterium LBB_01]